MWTFLKLSFPMTSMTYPMLWFFSPYFCGSSSVSPRCSPFSMWPGALVSLYTSLCEKHSKLLKNTFVVRVSKICTLTQVFFFLEYRSILLGRKMSFFISSSHRHSPQHPPHNLIIITSSIIFGIWRSQIFVQWILLNLIWYLSKVWGRVI